MTGGRLLAESVACACAPTDINAELIAKTIWFKFNFVNFSVAVDFIFSLSEYVKSSTKHVSVDRDHLVRAINVLRC